MHSSIGTRCFGARSVPGRTYRRDSECGLTEHHHTDNIRIRIRMAQIQDFISHEEQIRRDAAVISHLREQIKMLEQENQDLADQLADIIPISRQREERIEELEEANRLGAKNIAADLVDRAELTKAEAERDSAIIDLDTAIDLLHMAEHEWDDSAYRKLDILHGARGSRACGGEGE